jgi:DNA adenine methylase
MKYLGSKNRIAKEILPLMLKHRNNKTWVEPFVGGCNIINKVKGDRIGADSNEYLISLLKELQKGWKPIKDVTKDLFNDVRKNPDKYEKHIVAYIEILFTFGATWGRGFVGNVNDKVCKGRDRIGEGYRNALKTQKEIKGIKFIHSNYQDLEIPENSLIYCDPPYENTTGYKDDFNHLDFWQWCRNKAKEGHKVFISEYNAPGDFKCIWEKELKTPISKNSKVNKINSEKLFMYE